MSQSASLHPSRFSLQKRFICNLSKQNFLHCKWIQEKFFRQVKAEISQNKPESSRTGLPRRGQIILPESQRPHALRHAWRPALLLRLLVAVEKVGRRRRQELHAAAGRRVVAAWLRLLLRLLWEGGRGAANGRRRFFWGLRHAPPQDRSSVGNTWINETLACCRMETWRVY